MSTSSQEEQGETAASALVRQRRVSINCTKGRAALLAGGGGC
jgi:hypothetical protein